MANWTSGDLWVFGYGSLIWKPDLTFKARKVCCVKGFLRRYWQGSTDHRGVPGAPGRVVTLVPGTPTEECWGAAYCIDEADVPSALVQLDHREKGGYERRDVTLYLSDGTELSPHGMLYIACGENDEFLGDAPAADIAAQIAASAGPSGPNREYFDRLRAALEDLRIDDPHISEIAKFL